MRAVVQTRYGTPEAVLQVGELAKPRISDEEVLVQVRAASVHPDVWHVVAGRPWMLRWMGAGIRRPRNPVPGSDVAGVVVEVGSKAGRFAVGDEVFGETILGTQWNNGGAFAEYVSAPEESLAELPRGVSFEQAASVPTSGFIVWLNLPEREWFGTQRDVLVNGAGGGVGTIALQISKSLGAHVTAVDHTEKLDLLRNLGADRVIDYTREDFTRGDARYDLVFDVPGNHSYSTCRQALKPGGRYVLIGHESFGTEGRRIFGLITSFLLLMVRSRFDPQLGSGRTTVPSRRETMDLLRDLLAEGKLTPVVDRTFSLEEVPEALRYLASGQARGKILVTP
ncbi:MAG: NAD(P)-dependent alcohol dehydrogenase [Thermoanaerobaculia bacterium]|nr:NAD(P)-dependent alcohol dehydrogenase [Thermoanaerobaculia bacterium]